MPATAELGTLVRRAGWLSIVACAAATAIAVRPSPVGAQGPAAPPAVVLVAGVGASTPLMVDGNGTTVRLAPAPTVGLHVTPPRWRVGPLYAGAVARVASGALRLDDDGERWSAGRAWQLDLLAQASLPVRGDRVVVAGGAGATLLHAGRRPAPLRRALLAPAAEGTVLFRPAGPRWSLVVTAQGYLVHPTVGRAGGVGRLIAGATREF